MYAGVAVEIVLYIALGWVIGGIVGISDRGKPRILVLVILCGFLFFTAIFYFFGWHSRPILFKVILDYSMAWGIAMAFEKKVLPFFCLIDPRYYRGN